MSSKLYIVSTPIGNLQDITLRAIETLKDVDFIYCEDTRQTRKICSKYGIETPLRSYHEHNAQQVRPQIIELLQLGQSVALVSDAGTPLISDPGFKLVEECLFNGIKVSPVPGASALLSALVISGLPCDRFYFGGFLPSKTGERTQVLTQNKNLPWTQIYYESSHRLLACLEDIESVLECRKICIARELTKSFEEVKLGTARELIEYYNNEGTLKGEIVLLISGNMEGTEEISAQIEETLKILVDKWPTKKVVGIMADLTNLPKNMLYKKALELKNE